jgi:serine/threonine protein kinase/WD40 repeat protein
VGGQPIVGEGPSSDDRPGDAERDERLARVIFECTARVSSGQPLDVRTIYARHSDLLPELELAIDLLCDSSPAPSAAPGLEALGGHRILRELGRGGMGVVHEAVDLLLGRRVALKVMHLPSFADTARRDRFLREARAAARLHHTSIVPVFEVGEEQGILFYTMQYITGRSLDRVMGALARVTGRGRVDARPAEIEDEAAETIAALLLRGEGVPGAGRPYHRSVARLGMEIAGALAHAHREGVLHRDVKPSNLILDFRGAAWLADFGLAKSELESDGLTLSGDVVGTVAYMAPERFEGRGDARSDVYSLGATLYELLVLRPAFHEPARRQLLRKVCTEEPVSPRRIDRRIPRDLETIVLKAMARDPAGRYRSAAELREELGRFLRGEPIAARRASTLERAARWCRREPALAGLTGTVAVLLVTLLVGYAVSARSLRHRLYESELSNARALRLGGRPGRRFDSLAAIARAAKLEPAGANQRALRDEAISALTSVDLREALRQPEPLGRDGDAVLDADLERYAVNDRERGQIAVRRIADGAELRRLDTGDARAQGFSPDGRLLAALVRTAEGHSLRVFALEDGAVHLDHAVGRDGAAIALDRSAPRSLIASADGSVVALDWTTKAITPAARLPSRAWLLRLSPDGRRYAAQTEGRQVIDVLEVESGRKVCTIELTALANDAAWSPDGRVIATVSQAEGRIRLWDARTGDRFGTLEGHLGTALRVAFSPGGEVLASTSWDSTLRLWDPWNGDLLLTTTPPGLQIAFDRRGGRLASIGGELVVWELATGAERRVLISLAAPPATGGHYVSADPSGRLLATPWALWDLAAGRELDTGGRCPGGPLFAPGRNEVLADFGAGWVVRPFSVEARPEGDVLCWAMDRQISVFASGASAIAIDAAGRRLVAIESGGTVVALDLSRGEKRVLGTHDAADHLSLSPDGRWAASGTYNRGLGIVVWDLEAASLVRREETSAGARAHFSPDGRWLAIAAPGGFRVETAGDWITRYSIAREADTGLPAPLCWSPDGALIALEIAHADVLLVDASGGAAIAKLRSAQPRAALALDFTPGGQLLIGRANSTVEVWDLRRIHEGLAALGLELPGAIPAAPGPPAPLRPLRIEGLEVEGAQAGPPVEAASKPRDPAGLLRLGSSLQTDGNWKEAIRCYEEALERSSGSTQVQNALAWALATGPGELRDPRRAVELAESAVRAGGELPAYLNTLGVALYRAERFREAVDTLLRGGRAAGAVTAWDGFFIAMALKRQGLDALAADYYANALRWVERHPGLPKEESRELRAFREEAVGVLGEGSE